MALAAATAQQYFRQAGQQQVLYAYWQSAGDVARARLALNVANWYYQQLGIPFYYPTDFPGYVPSPTTPDAALTASTSLPAGGGLQAHDSGGFLDGSNGTALQEYCYYYPDDPICNGESGYDPGPTGPESGPIYISQPTTIIVNQQGLTLADVTSRISGALATAAAAIATAVDSALATAIAGIQHALNAIGNELASVFHLLSRLAGLILNFLKGLLLDVVKGLVNAVRAIGELLKNVLQHGIIPALQALQKLRAYLLKIYEQYLRPLLIMLQDLRKLLAILKVFHVGFATKLDNVLADIQAKISAPLLYLLRYTNAIANYINLILDARLFLQKPLFLASQNAYKGSSLNLLIGAMNPPPSAAAIASLQPAQPLPTAAQSGDALRQFLQTGGGPFAAGIVQQGAALRQFIAKTP